MGINWQSTNIAYAPTTNTIRIVILIEADTGDDAIREVQNQLTWLKEDLGDEAPEIPPPRKEWPAWAADLMAPLLYYREHREMPPGYRETHEPPPII